MSVATTGRRLQGLLGVGKDRRSYTPPRGLGLPRRGSVSVSAIARFSGAALRLSLLLGAGRWLVIAYLGSWLSCSSPGFRQLDDFSGEIVQQPGRRTSRS